MTAISLSTNEWRRFGYFVAVSLAIHLFLVFAVMPAGSLFSGDTFGDDDVNPIAERYAGAINKALPLSQEKLAKIETILAGIKGAAWSRDSMPNTFTKAAREIGVNVEDVKLVAALDSDRSKQGRRDIIVTLPWPEDSDASNIIILGFLAGEGTLKSNFSSHRFWIHLKGDDGAGRVAFETMDCRFFRNGRINASSFLYNSTWSDR